MERFHSHQRPLSGSSELNSTGLYFGSTLARKSTEGTSKDLPVESKWEILQSVNFEELRRNNINVNTTIGWLDNLETHMFNVLLYKWRHCEAFREALKCHGRFIVCGHDRYWTCGLTSRIAKVTKIKDHPGLNALGNLLQRLKTLVCSIDFDEFASMLPLALKEEEHDHPGGNGRPNIACDAERRMFDDAYLRRDQPIIVIARTRAMLAFERRHGAEAFDNEYEHLFEQ